MKRCLPVETLALSPVAKAIVCFMLAVGWP